MKFLRPGGGTVEIGEKARVCLLNHRQFNPKTREAGGILLGRLVDETQSVVIDEATAPTRLDRRGRFFFFRAWFPTQQHVDIAWRESSHTRIYLGEWHTHPEDDSSPSRRDLKNWLRIGRSAKYEQDFLLFVIVGRSSTQIWELGKGETVPVQLGSVPML